jgi:hypothetical protein
MTSPHAPHDEDHGVLIICTYPDGSLGSSWFRAYRRIKQTIRRGAFLARVDLVPLTALPETIDVLIGAPALSAAVKAVPGVVEVLVAEPERLQAHFDALVRRLIDDGRLVRGPGPARSVAVHRGFQALGDRGRLAD